MIDILLKFYGINRANKWIRYFASGLTLSVFSTIIFMIIFIEFSDNITSEIIIKLCLSISISSKIINYFMIKYKSTEILGLSRKLRKFQNKCRISRFEFSI